MKFFFNIIIAVGLFFSFSPEAQALRCDPLEILQKDNARVTLSNEAALTYFAQRDISKSKSKKNNNSANFTIKNIPFGLDSKSMSALSEQISQKLAVDFREKSHRSILISQLPSNALQAYRECLGSYGISVDAATDAHRESRFVVQVGWNGSPLSGKVKLALATNGNGKVQLIESDGSISNKTSISINAGSYRSFLVSERDTAMKTELISMASTNEGGAISEQYDIPAFKPFYVETTIMQGARIREYSKSGKYETRRKEACIKPSAGYIFVPSSARWVFDVTRGAVTSGITSRTPQQVCGFITARGRKKSAEIAGKLNVHQVKVRTHAESDTSESI